MKDKLLRIINHYGVRTELKKFNEESFELIEAILEYKFSEDDDYFPPEPYKKHIAEEMADCYVMLEQFRHHYGISNEEITDIMFAKIDRQIGRIENGE